MQIKLAWLQASALVLNPKDPNISAHVVVVLQQAKTSIEKLAHSGQSQTPQVRQSATMVSHVINSLLASCK